MNQQSWVVGHGSWAGVKFIFSLVLFCSLITQDSRLTTVFAAQTREEAKDTDSNGKPDEWRVYLPAGRQGEGESLVRIERDRDGDGRREVVVFMEAGKPVRSEVDRNGDGRPDLIQFLKNGMPERGQADQNFDGKPDAWTFYKEGTKDFLIMDKNFDGRPDAWFYYGQAGLKLVAGKIDENFDGTIDRSFGALPADESRQPW